MGNFAFTLYEEQLLPPANEVCEGYVFTGVCLSRGGGVRGCRGACVVAGGVWLPGGMCGEGGHGEGGCTAKGGVSDKGGHGEGGCVAKGACMVRGHAWQRGGHAWDMTRYGDTINERAVRILLECILVKSYYR